MKCIFLHILQPFACPLIVADFTAVSGVNASVHKVTVVELFILDLNLGIKEVIAKRIL